jgi:hypothetical protein
MGYMCVSVEMSVIAGETAGFCSKAGVKLSIDKHEKKGSDAMMVLQVRMAQAGEVMRSQDPRVGVTERGRIRISQRTWPICDLVSSPGIHCSTVH